MQLRYRSRNLPSLLAGLALLTALAAATPVSAQPFGWMVPTAADTFTIGVPHGIYWNGGPPGNLNIFIIEMTGFTNVGYVVLNSPNSGEVAWNIQNTLTPGPYQLYIEDVGTSTWAYSETFYLQGRLPCTVGCLATSTSQPSVVCGQTAAEADSLARAAALSQLQSNCSQGYAIDLSSVSYNVSFITSGPFNCPGGYGGAFAYEASATACCCPQPIPAVPSTWGNIKLLRR